MGKVIITFGLIAGLIVGSMFFITNPIQEDGSFNGGMIVGFTTMIIALSTIFFAVKVYRDKYQSGVIKFGKAFLIGIGVTAIATIMYSAAWEAYLSTTKLGPMGFINAYNEQMVQSLKDNNASAEELQKVIDDGVWMAEVYKAPVKRFFLTMIEIFPVGVLISLISALILKRKTAKNKIANA